MAEELEDVVVELPLDELEPVVELEPVEVELAVLEPDVDEPEVEDAEDETEEALPAKVNWTL